MFTAEEVGLIKLRYFSHKKVLSDICELESKNGDYWMIIKKQEYVPKKMLKYTYEFKYTFELYHRHANAEGFHYHSEFDSLLKAILEIIDHDCYRLKSGNVTHVT